MCSEGVLVRCCLFLVVFCSVLCCEELFACSLRQSVCVFVRVYSFLCCSQGCGVGVGSRWSRMFSAGVGVCFLKLLESVFQNCWSVSQESEHLLQLQTPMFIK